MPITFDDTFDLAVPLPVLWGLFWDIPAMARCVPGCESVDEVEPQKHYTASVRRKLGPFLMRMEMTIEVLESEPERSMRVRITGKDRKLRSEVSQTLAVTLEEQPPNSSRVSLVSEVELSGILGKLGANLIRTQLDATVREFFDNLRAAAAELPNPSA